MRRQLLSFPVLFCFAIPLFSQNAKTAIAVTDMLKIKSISGLTLTANGNRAAFTVTAIEPDGESKTDYKYVNHIYVMNSEGLEPAREMTTKESSSQPAWSPDGRQLAFVRAVDGKPQVFLLPMDGGEAIQFTHFRYGAGTPKWSPDGKTILFSSSLPLNDLIKDTILNPSHAVPKWSFEKPGVENESALKPSTAKADPDGNIEQVKAWLEMNEKDKKAKVIDKLNFQDEMNVSPDMAFNHFFVQSTTPGSSPFEITHGFYNYQDVDFITNGQRILITASIDSSEHPDRVLESGIYIADADGSHLEKILGEKEKRFSGASVSPTGSWLTFLRSSTSFVTVPSLFLMPLNGAVKDAIEIPVDRNKGGFTWSADEKYLYFTVQSNGGAPLYRLDVITKKADPLTDVNSGVISFDIKNNRLVYAKTEVTDPFDIYSADGTAQNSKRITSFNYDWVKNKELSMPEKHEFKNNKGVTIEYWVMKPLHAEKGKKYPLLLDIHGGPSAMWGPGEASMWHEFQFFCAKGYGVVYCNPRGSGGYGLNFLRGNVEDWGAGPTSDVLTALDKAVAEGWADTSKLLVSGGSYAGYLVAWIIAHDHRFKAACSQRGVYDLATFFGEGNAWRLVPNYFGGYPWEAKTKTILDRESPISYVQNIITPYIIFHGDNDRRTGFVEGEMLYRSLKVLGRPVEYVRHQNGTHELTRSGDNRQRMDQMLRTWEFFERWLKK